MKYSELNIKYNLVRDSFNVTGNVRKQEQLALIERAVEIFSNLEENTRTSSELDVYNITIRDDSEGILEVTSSTLDTRLTKDILRRFVTKRSEEVFR